MSSSKVNNNNQLINDAINKKAVTLLSNKAVYYIEEQNQYNILYNSPEWNGMSTEVQECRVLARQYCDNPERLENRNIKLVQGANGEISFEVTKTTAQTFGKDLSAHQNITIYRIERETGCISKIIYKLDVPYNNKNCVNAKAWFKCVFSWIENNIKRDHIGEELMATTNIAHLYTDLIGAVALS